MPQYFSEKSGFFGDVGSGESPGLDRCIAFETKGLLVGAGERGRKFACLSRARLSVIGCQSGYWRFLGVFGGGGGPGLESYKMLRNPAKCYEVLQNLANGAGLDDWPWTRNSGKKINFFKRYGPVHGGKLRGKVRMKD